MSYKKRYTIVVTEHSEEVVPAGKDWKQGAGNNPKEEDGNWGYTPEIEKKREVSREIYTQNTETLDLSEVIKAVNNLNKGV